MSAPSKEALEMAEQLYPYDSTTSIAIVFQELIDERNYWKRAAENRNEEWALKCEQAAEQRGRAEAAEAKLARCVRQVRAFNGRYSVTLDVILDDFELKTGEPVCKHYGVEQE